jgi:hypothetical protein
LKGYVARFAPKARWIVTAVVRWLGRAPVDAVVVVLEIVIVGFNARLLDAASGAIAFRDLMEILRDERLSSADLRHSLGFLAALRQRFELDRGELLQCLADIWRARSREGKIAKFITPLFLSLVAEGGALPASSDVFSDIAELIAAQEYHFDFPHLLELFVLMLDREIQVPGFPKEAAVIFALFLTKPRNALQAIGVEPRLLKEMHRCFKQIARRQKVVMRALEQAYAANPEMAARLQQVLTAPKVPAF